MAIQIGQFNPPPGVPGAVDIERPHTLISRQLESAALAFAQPVFRGARDTTCAAIGASGGFLGLAAMDPEVGPQNGLTYVQSDTVAILLSGFMWVIAALPVTPGQAVYFDASGKITSASIGNTPIQRATFESTAYAGKTVLVWLS